MALGIPEAQVAVNAPDEHGHEFLHLILYHGREGARWHAAKVDSEREVVCRGAQCVVHLTVGQPTRANIPDVLHGF